MKIAAYHGGSASHRAVVSRRSLLNVLLIVSALAVGAPAQANAQAASTENTQAAGDELNAVEALLFETDHLASIAHPAKLEYRFSWDGSAAFEDRIVLTLKGEGPLHDVESDYLSGVQHVAYPPVEQSRGNPLLLFFLEHDLREMQRETQGSPAYFRRLIRLALARADLKIEPTTVAVGNRQVSARRVVIEPYRSDPNAATRYPRLVGKTYEFILADDVPGQIVTLATHVVSAEGKTQTARVDWAALTPM
jgi:hypothetical protein